MIKICNVCKAPLDEDSKFCASCGAPVESQPTPEQTAPSRPEFETGTSFCSYCGAPLNDGALFCGACGAENPDYRARKPKVKTSPGISGKISSKGVRSFLVNALLIAATITLIIVGIKLIPDNIRDASLPYVPVEENVLDDEIQAEYDVLRNGGTLFGEPDTDAEERVYMDYSWIVEEAEEEDAGE